MNGRAIFEGVAAARQSAAIFSARSFPSILPSYFEAVWVMRVKSEEKVARSGEEREGKTNNGFLLRSLRHFARPFRSNNSVYSPNFFHFPAAWKGRAVEPD